VLNFADATFLQHVVANITKHLKLLKTGEFNTLRGLTDDLEKIPFEHWSLALMRLL